jgi:taurine dioxygenase
MPSLKVSPLAEDIPFGAKVAGVTWETLHDESVRRQIRDVFERRGVVVFKDIEQTERMHFGLSEIIGPLEDHPFRPRADKDDKPTVANLSYRGDLVEVDGTRIVGWLPWHYDACYQAKLNRAAVLRPVEIPPEGGLTGFADGVQLYQAVSPALRAKFEDVKIIYHAYLMYMNQRFGMPKNRRWIALGEGLSRAIEARQHTARSLHPAIWRRKSGEAVLHVSPWQAAGIEGREDDAGNALLEELCGEIYAKMQAYWHKWDLNDMVLWDNWRMIHSASGNDPKYGRHLQRTTIEGDYGLGSYEHGAKGESAPELMV